MMHCSFNTCMAVLQHCRITTSAFCAVKEILPATNSTYSTTMAVILLFWDIIIKELAHFTEILSHTYTTTDAYLPYLLFSTTQGAYNLLHFMTWKFMPPNHISFNWILRFIVAVPAIKNLVAAWCSYAASPSVMWTPVLHQSLLQPLIIITARTIDLGCVLSIK